MDREKLLYKSTTTTTTTTTNTYNFKDFRTIRTSGEDIYNGEISLDEADEYQSDLADKISDFIKKQSLKVKRKNKKRKT